MKRDLVISAVVIVCFVGASIANADLILKIDSQDATGIPFMESGTGPYQIALDGNTAIEPNDVRLEAVGGTLTIISDVNHQYSFQYDTGSTAGLIWLISDTEIILDGITIPADTVVYELFVFTNPDVNLTGACGSDYSFLNPPPEEEGGQDDSITEEPTEPTGELTEEMPIEIQSQPVNDFNSLLPVVIRQEKQKVLMNCPNSIEGIAHARLSKEEFESFAITDDGGGQYLLDGTIEISSDITINQIWSANNTYHITAGISIQALLVIEPGTIIEYASGTWMTVNNGGTLISCGTPDNPIIYTSDSIEPWYGDYSCAILIEETASASTKITYNYIEFAEEGIWVMNNRLDSPIENNYLYNNSFGILEYGIEYTDIYNNLIIDSYYNAIEINMKSYENLADASSHIIIQNNTCDNYQDVGIAVFGVDNEEDAGEVDITNNIVSGSYQCGLVLANGWIIFTVANTGYYDNELDKNWEFTEYNPVFETELPYVTGTGILPVCYLNPDCNFINAGYEYIEGTRLIGKTTEINNFPDNNFIDIGFHYPNWDYSNAGDGNSLTIDLNADSIVNFKDFAILAATWQTAYYIDDLNTIADEWLKIGSEPNVQIQIIGDSNNGFVNVGFSGFTSGSLRNFLFIDGQYRGENLEVDVSSLGSGTHELKAIGIDNNDKIICSNIAPISFTCPFNYCPPGFYDHNEPYHFKAFYQGSDNIIVNVYAEDNNLIWTQTYSSDNFNGTIPTSITLREDLVSITYEPSSGGGVIVKKPFVLSFNPKNIDENIRALFILPVSSINWLNGDVEGAVAKAFKTRHVPFYKLKAGNATYDNLAWFARNRRNIEYIYYAGHGGYDLIEFNGIFRTTILLSDGNAVSAKQSDFPPGSAPAWCEPLPGNQERTVHSIYKLGFNPGKLKFVHFDCCKAGRLRLTSDHRLIESPSGYDGILAGPESDMSWALNMRGGYYGNFYQSWRGELTKSFGMPITDTFSVFEWTELKDGENYSQALFDTVAEITTHPYGNVARDNFRVYGMGDASAVKIE